MKKNDHLWTESSVLSIKIMLFKWRDFLGNMIQQTETSGINVLQAVTEHCVDIEVLINNSPFSEAINLTLFPYTNQRTPFKRSILKMGWIPLSQLNPKKQLVPATVKSYYNSFDKWWILEISIQEWFNQ